MMNKIKTIILLSFTMCLSLILHAQEDSSPLLLKGIATESNIKLRWMPDNYNIWQASINTGYTIERTTVSDGTESYSLQDMHDSKTILISNFQPMSENEFNSTFQASDSTAHVVKKILYDNTIQPTLSDNRNLADAVAYQDHIESKFLFSMLISEGSFEIAKALAIGYEDDNVIEDNTYLYKLTLINDGDIYTQEFTVTYTGNLEMPAPNRLLGDGEDLAANLSWDIKPTNEYYNLYNIQRSRDNSDFVTVNTVPFVYMSEVSDDPETAFYQDALPDNNNPYYYRIVGLSPFGIESPPSDTVMVTGIPARLDITMTIDSLHEVTEGNLRIDWRSIPDRLTNDLSQFDIYIKSSKDAIETKLNPSPILPNERYYDRVNAPSVAYYRLEATDRNGHVYSSLSFAGQVVDKTPPAAPIVTAGKILRDGTVVLSWQNNTEEDLQGYKVFYSNVKNGEYSTTETEVRLDTFQIGSINTAIDTDSIFYKVAAYDLRYNRSEFSEIISLERPDDVAPANPVIAQILARPEGIRISWLLSNTSDVNTYTLQRKTTESTSWNNILSFTPDDVPTALPITPAEQVASHYIDEDNLQLRYYNYRLIAEDNFDNQAASPIKTIKPYDDLIRGEIREYIAYIPQGQSLSNDLSANTGGTFTTEGVEITNVINSTVRLQWQYKNTNKSELKEFKIYMQEVKPGVSPTDPILEHVPYMLINTITARNAETTALSQGYSGYMYLHDLARTPGFKYNFKIMAYHTDGGFSEFTDSVAVPH